jgi:hypothetical protein
MKYKLFYSVEKKMKIYFGLQQIFGHSSFVQKFKGHMRVRTRTHTEEEEEGQNRQREPGTISKPPTS